MRLRQNSSKPKYSPLDFTFFQMKQHLVQTGSTQIFLIHNCWVSMQFFCGFSTSIRNTLHNWNLVAVAFVTWIVCESYTSKSAPWVASVAESINVLFRVWVFLHLGNSTLFFETCPYYKYIAVIPHHIISFFLFVHFLFSSKCEIKHYSIYCGKPQYCIIRSQETQVHNRAFSFSFKQNMSLLFWF